VVLIDIAHYSPGIIRALTIYGSATTEQAMELVSQMDPDRTGRINYGEYVDLITQTHRHP